MILKKRIEGDDGKVAICIFLRDDDSCQFRIDRLRPEDAETLAYWVEGYPLSGLYPTVDEAEAAARVGLNWNVA